ncbi:hypothetical protein P350_10055 [Burkholderia cepacia JBK9]|uniref:hypothetical protein n=1 Tax=Burkholderia arboris TaxID=488730 RepID=UPI0004D92E61|nr:hypothetical protein [Burkholderia arboris]ALX11866.1 hypothetical protein P350_10055 [Burkholderia cepacia JBK9]
MKKRDDFRPGNSGIRDAAPRISTRPATNGACARRRGIARERIDGNIVSIAFGEAIDADASRHDRPD